MEWSDLPQDPRALLTAAAFFAATRWLWPLAQGKLEEVRAKAKLAALDLGRKLVREAIRYARNEAKRRIRRGVDPDRAPANGPYTGGLTGDELESLALLQVKKLAEGPLKKWADSDWLSLIRSEYETLLEEERQFEREVAALASKADTALADMNRRINAAMTKQKALGLETDTNPVNPIVGPGAGG
jgi:ribosomal protein S18 acetylase RimI-like enzyme